MHPMMLHNNNKFLGQTSGAKNKTKKAVYFHSNIRFRVGRAPTPAVIDEKRPHHHDDGHDDGQHSLCFYGWNRPRQDKHTQKMMKKKDERPTLSFFYLQFAYKCVYCKAQGSSSYCTPILCSRDAMRVLRVWVNTCWSWRGTRRLGGEGAAHLLRIQLKMRQTKKKKKRNITELKKKKDRNVGPCVADLC